MDEKPIYDWGQSMPSAPSIKRVDPVGWLAASLFAGAFAALFALLISWRELPFLALPPGGPFEHIGHWLKYLARVPFDAFFREDARLYRRFLSELGDEQRRGLIWRAAFAAWAFCMPGVFLAKSCLTPRDGLIHLRGSRRHAGPEAVARLVASMRAQVERRPDHEIAPGVAYPADMFTRHVLVVAGVGAGKSTALKGLINKIVESNEQMLLFDPKSEFTIGFAKPAILAPWDSRSLAWDIARDMRNLLDMRRFAATMIRESQDPMWSNASRQLLVGLMIYLKGTRGAEWGWGELRELVSLPQTQLLSIMREWHPEAMRAVEKASVTTAGILINLSSFCSSIFDLAEAWGATPADRRISFVEWTQGGSKFPQVILQGHGAYADLTKSYVEGIVGIVSAIVNSVEMEDDHNRKIWFVADEFAQIGKIPVRSLFEVGRSRGVRCVVACQDFAQLEELYGAAMVKALIGMCGTLIVGQMMQGETAEQICKAFGTREVERANLSASYNGPSGGARRSTTLSYNRDEVALYKPSELSSRLGLTPDGKGVALILFTGGHAYELVWPHFPMRRERSGHEPAPWTTGVAAITQRVEQAREDERRAREQASEISPSSAGSVASVSSDGGLGGTVEGQAELRLGSTPAPARDALGLGGDVGDARGECPIRESEPLNVPMVVDSAPCGASAQRGAAPHIDPLADAVADAALRSAGLEGASLATVALAVANALSDSRVGARERVSLTPTPPQVPPKAKRISPAESADRKARRPSQS